MPRNSQAMLFRYGAGANYLQNAIPVTNSSVFPIATTEVEETKFTEVRSLLTESMSRVIRREPNTNSILALIARGRTILKDLKKDMTY